MRDIHNRRSLKSFWYQHQLLVYEYILYAISPLEMCAVGGLVRRGALSYIWRVTTVPVVFYWPDRREHIRS